MVGVNVKLKAKHAKVTGVLNVNGEPLLLSSSSHRTVIQISAICFVSNSSNPKRISLDTLNDHLNSGAVLVACGYGQRVRIVVYLSGLLDNHIICQ